MNNVLLKKRRTLVAAGLLVFIFMGGLYVRTIRTGHYLPYHTVASYYYDKSNRLNNDGVFPKTDIWDFAPDARIDNAPPGLAYITVFLYRVFGGRTAFYDFAQTFPLFIYAAWFIMLVLSFRKLFGALITLGGAALFAFLPVSAFFTTRGHYLEETLGALLIFIMVHCIIRIPEEKERRQRHILSISLLLSTALFALTWQQYIVVLGAAGALIALWAFKKSVASAGLLALAIAGGVFLAEAWCRLAGLGYSPLMMAWEFIYATIHHNDPALYAAMRRTDWANPGLKDLYSYFGALGILAGILGVFSVLTDLKNSRKQVIGIFAAAGLVVLAAFVKDRFLALTLFLYLFALGLDVLIHPEMIRRAFKSFFSLPGVARSLCIVGAHKKELTAGVCVLIASGIVFTLFSDTILSKTLYRNKPLPIITVSSGNTPLKVGGSYKVVLTLKNTGGRPLSGDSVFGGLHVEIENAIVKNIRAYSRFTKSEASLKNFAWAGDKFFFETKYYFLNSSEDGGVTFVVEPYALPVTIYYRGWLPGFCTKEERGTALNDLLPAWKRDDKGGWRNESCIMRAPETPENGATLCRIPVMAAHQAIQDFPCFEKQL
ncbi:MAG: hypothetical protein A3H69_05300 [Candidatus Sungbacteria bacterium RIFCSPLOWO2_02_FULL_47_9]|uniref:Glycosyltransferase RgtA/B/C/D-like domain-containing protein n=1 Tax=Candidatus Sungbacteria bacterium RIFCSPHIGHO2_01_FULL_47_32 TaxID=1802264 RepID=A0A1G2K4E0_9BACT|nr:MAG: hypothetical protein UX72_C0001G0053 [Parcubacteria group bacterium GW2011_GWA2_47_10]OGZ94277.1 MAG: hypothetical protein A2633_05705 [Candidatus Sungbacteria bacterium RIFCSPHIGHO2_01_FULL_47_32]OGZ99746.1 MAG: hypothetical protein A3D57_02495 [Candidatus Sungbacteria bacterium RIFCSPHIGHO2_02_FULL_46_12]OHA05918.1 MAG: hypothetical protein A3A28_02835 [Candidatus Sungbacteria bacterium RIFCSPLOWO2_01_FULL_47_32]OHA10297.1 MAG: hypothetical protein A3H69_05300 [Candidatus Sungbacteria